MIEKYNENEGSPCFVDDVMAINGDFFLQWLVFVAENATSALGKEEQSSVCKKD